MQILGPLQSPDMELLEMSPGYQQLRRGASRVWSVVVSDLI